jgi:hypothetical protein
MRQIGIAGCLLFACGGVQEKSDDNPAVESVVPSSSPQSGGVEVTLTGRGLDFGDETPTRVVVGSAVVDATIVDDSTITFIAPPQGEGPAALFLFNGGGSVAVLDSFTYAPLPEIREIDPSLATSGTPVTVRGAGFERNNPGTITVELGGAELEGVTVVSDTVLTGTVPARVDEPFLAVDATVTTANGSVTLGGGFRYVGSGLFGVRALKDPSIGSRNESLRGLWYYVDPDTAEARFIARSPVPVTQATAASDGSVVALVSTERFGADRRFGTVITDDFSVDAMNVVTPSLSVRIQDIVVDGQDYFEYSGSTTVRRYDLATGTIVATLPALNPALNLQACLFRNNATTLFAIGLLDGTLNTVNKTTGAVIAGAQITGVPAGLNCHGATRIGNDTFVLGWDRTETTLFRLTGLPAAPVLTPVGVIRENGISVPMRSVVPTPPNL